MSGITEPGLTKVDMLTAHTCPSAKPSISQMQRAKAVIGATCNIPHPPHGKMDERG
jgi:hypothetical protein